jgi:hypothetical protein
MNHKLALILALALGSTAADLSFDRFLDRSSKAAERETAFLASVACTETVVETKIGIKNKPESQSRRVFDYFVLVDTAGGDLSVNESRIEQGKVKNSKQLLQSTGFALLSLIFHPCFQQSFTMTEEGMESMDKRVWHKVSFQYRPGKRSPTLLRTGAREYPISWEGEAWLDEKTGRVGRIRARVAAQLEEIGIKSMEADVRYGPAENLGSTTEWAPLEALVDLQTAHQHWRNTHTFSNFRKFEVDTTEQRSNKPK